jgi:hypothetical protein
MTLIKSGLMHTYLMQLHGALCSSTIDWCGDVTIAPQEHGKSLLIYCRDSCCLDQFQDLLDYSAG